MTEKEEVSLSKAVAEPVKIGRPVPKFKDSDTEDEEVIISGNMRRQFKNKTKARVRKK